MAIIAMIYTPDRPAKMVLRTSAWKLQKKTRKTPKTDKTTEDDLQLSEQWIL